MNSSGSPFADLRPRYRGRSQQENQELSTVGIQQKSEHARDHNQKELGEFTKIRARTAAIGQEQSNARGHGPKAEDADAGKHSAVQVDPQREE